jgi:hypothetical protein
MSATSATSPHYVECGWHWDDMEIMFASQATTGGRVASSRLGALTSIHYQSSFNLGEGQKAEVFKIGINDGQNLENTPIFAFQCSLIEKKKMPANLRELLPTPDLDGKQTATAHRAFSSK